MAWEDQQRVPAALSAAVTMGITTAWPNAAAAHATGQSFVALLPTGPYMAVGVATVALSIMLLWFLPQRSASTLLPHRNIGRVAAAPAAKIKGLDGNGLKNRRKKKSERRKVLAHAVIII